MTRPRLALAAVLGAVLTFLCGAGVGASMMQSAPGPLPAPDRSRMDPLPFTLPLEYTQWVMYYSDETGVPAWIYCRTAAWESGWNPRFIGRANADGSRDLGLSGINSRNLDLATQQGRDFARLYNDGARIDPLDPETAIRVGMRYLSGLYSLSHNWRVAVGMYNAGPYRAIATWSDTTKRHVRAIMGS